MLDADEKKVFAELLDKKQLALVLGKMFPPKSRQIESPYFRRNLYYIQCWALVKYEDQMNSFCNDDPRKQKLASKMIRDLTTLAKDDQDGGPMLRTNTLTLSKPKKSNNNFANDNKLLGFKNTVNPTQDFKTPPGLLALTLMHTFAMTNGEDFLRLGKIMAVRLCIHISCQSPILIVESMSYRGATI